MRYTYRRKIPVKTASQTDLYFELHHSRIVVSPKPINGPMFWNDWGQYTVAVPWAAD